LLIVILARATALATPDRWFSPAISALFYEMTLVVASILALAIAAIVMARISRFDATLRVLDLEIATLGPGVKGGIVSDDGPSPRSPQSAVADVIRRLETVGGGTVAEERVGHDAIIGLSSVVQRQGVEDRQALREELGRQRARISASRDRMWPGAVGPISLSLVFVAIAGTMLPGVEGFLVANFRLNTAFILLIAYSWWLLVAWSVVAIATLPTDTVEPGAAPRPQVFERFE